MALRVRVELIPFGIGEPKILDDITIVNNGTGISGGYDSGGVGNYDVYDAPIQDVHAAAEKSFEAQSALKVGEVRELERTPEHRTKLARLALEVVEEARKG